MFFGAGLPFHTEPVPPFIPTSLTGRSSSTPVPPLHFLTTLMLNKGASVLALNPCEKAKREKDFLLGVLRQRLI